MNNRFFSVGAALAGLAVALGAFGAHGLQKIADEKTVEVFKTGVTYHFYHALALLAVALAANYANKKWLQIAGSLLIMGIIAFSGSLYAITYCKVHTTVDYSFIGPITPIGGLFFMAGWVCLVVSVKKGRGGS